MATVFVVIAAQARVCCVRYLSRECESRQPRQAGPELTKWHQTQARGWGLLSGLGRGEKAASGWSTQCNLPHPPGPSPLLRVTQARLELRPHIPPASEPLGLKLNTTSTEMISQG